MIAMGIVDPVKVVRTALQDAASVAGLLITTEAMIAEAAEEGRSDAGNARRRHGRHGRHGLLRKSIARPSTDSAQARRAGLSGGMDF